jgi:hypothetical protein
VAVAALRHLLILACLSWMACGETTEHRTGGMAGALAPEPSARAPAAGGDGAAGTAQGPSAGAPAVDGPAVGMPPDDNGGPIGIGPTPSCSAEQCAEEAEYWASLLSAPPVVGSGRRFNSGRCVTVGFVGGATGAACECSIADSDGTIFIGPEGAGCFAFGRAGACLWDDAEFDGCSMGANDPCDATCAELETRYAADAETDFDVALRYSECADSGYCHFVLHIEDACFVDHSYHQGRAFDCTLDDAAIIAAYLQSQATEPVPSCDDPGAGENGTCAEPAPARECVERPAGEWQGNLVCGPYPPCERPDGCGLALACIDGLCGACTRDEQCAPGEGCALDHCMPSASIGCRTRSDCSGDALCILSGITGGTARGNEDLRAYCLSPSGGSPMAP